MASFRELLKQTKAEIREISPADAEARAVFDALETARVEALGARLMDGVRSNLGHHVEAQLRADARASKFWDAATPSYRKLATNWVVTAKQEATRDKRMAELVDDCHHGRLIKTQRYGTEPAWVRRVRDELG